MKNSKLGRILLLLACAVLLVCLSVGATLAYLTSSDTNVNTFTVGDVKIVLDEAKVTDEDGRVADHATRVKTNKYHMQPGLVYQKDPTVTVKANSENCYVRMLVTMDNYNKVQTAFPADRYPDFFWKDEEGNSYLRLAALVCGWDTNTWKFVKATIDTTANTCTYEFRYKEIVATSTTDTVLDDLFETINPPATMNNTEIGVLNNTTITVVAQAIQSDNFKAEGDKTAEDVAWEAFAQNYHDFNEAAMKDAIVNPKTETEGEE